MPAAGLDRVRWLAGPPILLPTSPALLPALPESCPHLSALPRRPSFPSLSAWPLCLPSLPLPPFLSSADTFQLLHPVSNVTLDFSWGFFF